MPLGVEGAIVGKALYAGAFTLPEALVGGAQLMAGSDSAGVPWEGRSFDHA